MEILLAGLCAFVWVVVVVYAVARLVQVVFQIVASRRHDSKPPDAAE